MSSVLITFLVLLLVCFPSVLGWFCWWNCGGGCSGGCLDNCYDGILNVQCDSRSAFYRVRSYHKNCKEDRIWDWYCRRVVESGYFSQCTWTSYQNNWDQPLFFRCPPNQVMRGVYSHHDNGREDRRWRFRCCKANKHYTKNCKISNYVNSWDGDMDFNAGNNYAIVGAFSYHDNGKEDRLWKFETCEYYYCPNYPNCGSSICEHYQSGSQCRCYSGYKLSSNGRTCTDIDECSSNNGGCKHICSNKLGSYSCSCYPGYYKTWWNTKQCYDTNECGSNNGGCQHYCKNTVGSFYCSCKTGFAIASNDRSCIDINECYYNNGGCQHGCVNTYGSYYCYCNSGYKLNSDSKTCSPSCWNPCKKCASCENPNKCSCVPGWTGPTCCTDINECSSSNGGCAQNCHNTHGSYYCSCNQGYQISTLNDKSCKDINECATGTHGCEHTCVNTHGSYKCYCNSGYVLDDNHKSCTNANECKIGNGGCQDFCTDTPGSYKCSCKDGYQLHSNKHTCYDINECALGTDTCEHDCYNTVGSYKCDCQDGYQLNNDGHCSDINECLTNDGGCQHTCVNDVGSFHCECNDGFNLDYNGFTCSDHDECEDNNPCEQNCKNVQGAYVCSCSNGYSLRSDGRTCEDINECSGHNTACNQLCFNTVGSYYCSCYDDGFQLSSDKHTCVDKDECDSNNGGCDHTCQNTEGSFTCSCESGHSLQSDGTTCSDDNECDIYNGGCDQTCTNTDGSYSCSCGDGYELDSNNLDCNDINECSAPNHGCTQTCLNTVGSYYCSCAIGYMLSTDDNRTCIDINECIEGEAECDQDCTNNEGSYECSCDTGYNLDGDKHTCNDINECVTKNGGCEDNCTNTDGSYACYCGEGFRLSDDAHSCEDINECEDDDYNECDHTCENTVGSYECKCNEGYYLDSDGFQCKDIDECDWGVGCGQECFNTDGSYYCDCLTGYVLANDSHNCTDIPECDYNLCEQNCTEYPGSYACFCIEGFRLGKDNHSCEDINECYTNTSGCDQLCINLNGTFVCDCYDGYELQGELYCVEIDECAADDNGGCEEQCMNLEGSYRCSCPPGYSLGEDGHSCPDTNECLDDNGGCNQTCINSNGSYSCNCSIGYTINANGKECDDINECTLYIHECDQYCHNTVGSYICSCEAGYVEDGKTCLDVDECMANTSNCDQLCTNINGSYTCSCYTGYSLDDDDHTCNDINECSSDNGGCDTTCYNTIGSYVCECNEGYRLSANNHSCEDINECSEDLHQCHHTCINTDGSYACNCSTGYSLNSDGLTCVDINECDKINGGCDQVCFNEVGSYHCDCGIGYELGKDSHSCYDIPECDFNICDQVCTETIGSYICSCKIGFYLSSDNHSCEDINECQISSENKCDHLCNNTNGSFECGCEHGYKLLSDHYTCEDINECDFENGNCAHNCNNKLGAYECSCDEGYSLDADSHDCIAQKCLNPYTPPLNGVMDCSVNGQVTDTSCSFSCDPGYELIGSSITYCLPNNTWSHPRPSCSIGHCDEYAPPANSFPIGSNPCPTVFSSECEVACVDGFRHVGGTTVQKCIWDNITETIQFSEPKIICERISVCESNPCLHNGYCTGSGTDDGFVCDCSGTGYKGDLCETGVITISKFPVLTINNPSRLLKLSAHPDDSLTIKLVYDTSISSNIKDIHFDSDVNSALFQLTGTQEGVYTLSFELSGPSKEDFEAPSPLVLLVTSDSIINPISNISSYRSSSGCCHYDTQHQCNGVEDETIFFSSTCQWDNQSSVLSNGGVVYANINELHVPVSIFGITASFETNSIKMALPSELSTCQSCDSCIQDDHVSQPSVDDAVYLLANNFLKQTLINTFQPVVPEQYSLDLETVSLSSSLSLSKYDFMNFVGYRQDLINEGICGDIQVTEEDSVYVATVINTPAAFKYGSDVMFSYSPTDNLNFCVALKLDCSRSMHNVILNIPRELSNVLQDHFTDMNILHDDDQLLLSQLFLQKNGIFNNAESSTSDQVWNGQSMIIMPSEAYDVRQLVSLEKTFKGINGVSVNAVLEGDLYHHSKSSHMTTGKFSASGKMSITLHNLYQQFQLVLSPEKPIYFSLNGYSDIESAIESGIALRGDLVVIEEPNVESAVMTLFSKSPGTQMCSFDGFIKLNEANSINWISLLSSCISSSINGVSFPGGQNKFRHSILIKSDESNSPVPYSFNSTGAPIQVVADVSVVGVPLNKFMKVMQPSTGNALLIQIWHDQEEKNMAILPMVEIDLYGTQTITEVTVDFNGVYFEYDTELFDKIKAHITGKSASVGDWNDMLFNISIDVEPNQEFMSNLQPSIIMYISSKANLLSNRLSNLLNVRNTLDSLIAEQTVKVNESKAVLDAHTTQYSELKSEIENMEETYKSAYLLYEQSKDDIYHSEMYSKLQKVCNVQECDLQCHTTPVLSTVVDFDYIYDWQPVNMSVTEEQLSVSTEMFSEKDWTVGKKCRPATIIKEWGVAAIGQDCSYQCHITDHMRYKTFSTITDRKTSIYGVGEHARYSYRDDSMNVTSNDCGLMLNNTDCLLNNSACVTMWSVIHNVTGTTQKALISPVLNYWKVKSDIDVRRLKLLILDEHVKLYSKVYENEVSALEHLRKLHKSTEDNFSSLNLLMNSYKSLKDSDVFSMLNITSLVIESRFKGEMTNGAKLLIGYTEPTDGKSTLIIDVYMDSALPLSIWKEQIIEKLFQQLSSVSSPLAFPVKSLAQYNSLKCSSIDSNYIQLTKIAELLKSQNHSYMSVKLTTDTIYDMLVIQQTESNITANVNVTASTNIFSTVTTIKELQKLIEEDDLVGSMMTSVFELNDTTNTYTKVYTQQQFYNLLQTLDSVYTADSIKHINGEICYGLFDCLKQIDYATSEAYKSTPIKFTTYGNYFNAAYMFNSSMVLNNADSITTVQESLMSYWCGDAPFFTDMSDKTVYIHTGSTHHLSCSQTLQSSLSITSYTWFKDGYQLSVGEQLDTLVIENASPLDSGWYQCMAGNGIGQVLSPVWSLEVVDKATITSNPIDTNTFEGNDNGAKFSCNASIQEGSTYAWYYSQYKTGDDWVMVSNDSNQLVVYNPLKIDEGWYRCEVTSANSKIVSNVGHLTVLKASISRLEKEAIFGIDVEGLDLAEWNIEDISNQLNVTLEPTYSKIKVQNVSVFENTLTVTVRISVQYNYNPYMDLPEIASEATKYKQDLIDTVEKLSSKISSHKLIITFQGQSLKAVTNSLKLKTTEHICPPGSGLQYNDFICVICLPGEVGNSGVCQPCPRDTYQSKEGGASCMQCPPTYGTKVVGATQKSDCTEYCPPGTTSDTGFPPCSDCDEGFYLLEYGGTACIECQPSDHDIPQCPFYNTSQVIVSPSDTPSSINNETSADSHSSNIMKLLIISFGSVATVLIAFSVISALVIYRKIRAKTFLTNINDDQEDALNSGNVTRINPVFDPEISNVYEDIDNTYEEIDDDTEK